MAAVNSISGSRANEPAPDVASHGSESAVAGRTLVCVGASQVIAIPPCPSSRRPSAAFLAHLIAVREQAPQMRERRRAAPQEGAKAYIDAAQRGWFAQGKVLRSA